ncbi:MAG: PepSY domain-containing protein [Gammaproteobacteria bacterium]|nr:PepSY domain-containing protein [Gammaproteobacteria bacterium]
MRESSRSNRPRNVIATLLASSALAFCTFAMAYSGEELAKDAKIGIQSARDIALKVHPGKITDEELEKEKGGSGLRYSFDIKVGSKTYEVGVDAVTGKVLENKREGKHPD